MRPLRCSGSSRVVNRILYDLNSKWKGHLFCIFEGKCFETRGGNNTTSSIQQDLNCTLHCLWWQWWLQFSWGGGDNCLWEGFSNGGNNRHRQQQLDSFHTWPNLINLIRTLRTVVGQYKIYDEQLTVSGCIQRYLAFLCGAACKSSKTYPLQHRLWVT